MPPSRAIILDQLRTSKEPSIRYAIALKLDHKDPNSINMRKLQAAIKTSPRVQSLLSNIGGIYNKWQGVHWVLSLLAELYYPPGDKSLHSYRNQVYEWLFSPKFVKSIKTIQGKVRRCASQEGNAIYYSHALGITDERTDRLVDRLLEFQWEDGGWNCDKNPKAHHSSYHESLIPLRALITHLNHLSNQKGDETKKKEIKTAIINAKEIFLKRELFLSTTTREIIHPHFPLLHFPYYWRYNVLFALKVLNEGGFLEDPRCEKALNLIVSKELPSGGFPAEKKYYTVSSTAQSGRSAVNWGGTGKRRMNEWVTSELFQVLNAAHRF